MGEVDLLSNSSLGASLIFFWQHFSPIANTKYDSAAADTRHEPATTVQSFQQPDSRHEPATVVQSWRNCQACQTAAGTLWAVLGQVSLNGNITISWVQKRYVKQTNTCVSLVKNSEVEQTKPRLNASLPLSVGSYLYFFIKCLFTCWIYSNILSPVSASGKQSFMCLL